MVISRTFLCWALFLPLSTDAFAPLSTTIKTTGHCINSAGSSPSTGSSALYANGKFRAKVKSIFRRNNDTKDEQGDTTKNESASTAPAKPKPKAVAVAVAPSVEKPKAVLPAPNKAEKPPPAPKKAAPKIATASEIATSSPLKKLSPAKQIDEELTAKNPQAAMDILQKTQFLTEDLYWRYVSVHYELAALSATSSVQERIYLEQGLQFAKLGLENDRFGPGPTTDKLVKLKAMILDKQQRTPSPPNV